MPLDHLGYYFPWFLNYPFSPSDFFLLENAIRNQCWAVYVLIAENIACHCFYGLSGDRARKYYVCVLICIGTRMYLNILHDDLYLSILDCLYLRFSACKFWGGLFDMFLDNTKFPAINY